MSHNEIFESSVDSREHFAGVYEHDEDAGYFYLYDLLRPEGRKIIGAIRVFAGPVTDAEAKLSICWSEDGELVGLFIEDVLRAAFNAKTQEKFGDEENESVRQERLAAISDNFVIR